MQIEVPILETTKESQNQHGLKYENHRRYRSYCSRRLHRLRRSLNVHQGIQSSAKARHQRGRKLMDINNSMVLEAGEKNAEYGERMLLIPLILTERAWSYAMELKQDTSSHPRRAYHMLRRLKKATEHAARFEKLCHDPESPCTDRTKEEATAYAAYIIGVYNFERQNLAEAKEHLSKALSIYFKLSISVDKKEVLESYRQRIDELRSNIKYCMYSLDDQKGSDKNASLRLPSKLQFHDLAFRHAKDLELESVSAKKSDDETGKLNEKLADATLDDDDNEEDEFEETREALDDGSDDDAEEEKEQDKGGDSNDKKSSTSRVGGVTGLVKNWLGGAWS